MRQWKLPTRNSYEDALIVAAIVLVCVCLLFMGVALVLASWAAALWSIITLVGSMTIVFIVALIIENRTKKEDSSGA